MKYLLIGPDGFFKQTDTISDEDRANVDCADLDIVRVENGKFEKLVVDMQEIDEPVEDEVTVDTRPVGDTWYEFGEDRWSPIDE